MISGMGLAVNSDTASVACVSDMSVSRAWERWGREMGADLDTVYGSVERRVSCESALARTAPVAVATGCVSVNAPFPESDVQQFCGEPLLHYAENAETLKVGAVEIAERTWMSSALRAMLDVACFSFSHRCAEYLLKAVLSVELAADEMIELAGHSRQEHGLRKIAAVCSLADEQHRRGWHRQILDWAKSADGDMVPVWKGLGESDIWSEDDERDEEFKVIWNISRKEVYESVYRKA